MDGELKQLEEELERLAPAGLPEGLISRMEAAMVAWEEVDSGNEEKVVQFPQDETSAGKSGFWAVAAAVALLGAVVALVIPGTQTEPNVAEANTETNTGTNYAAVSFSPTELNRNIIQASDGGVVLTKDARPHRAVRVEYMNRVKFRNAAGEELYIEKPAVKIVLIPVETD